MTEEGWEDLVDRFADGDVSRGHMFGCQGLRTGRRFFAIRWDGHLVLKLPPARLTALVEAGDGTPFEPMEGRPMNGWVVLGGSADPAPLVEQAREFVAAQPA
ncbi:TfoX/Sxy family protein [Blastococcus saxobsidens]|uniref:TfoX/Sxy family protein n=1 Tax=Blastococcus saxobsidens TaxID=138336 RepID=A0A6L9W2G4_9ACTN|nr:TfoX/Sxy family protein [Blastococcus saxobsidens]NEK86178.1 TfoX/Sxy family protein [Blastococcus saxobsidens]